MNKATINKSRPTMSSQTPQRSTSKVKATDITAHVTSDSSLCVDLTTTSSTFRQHGLLIAKRRQQTASVNVDPPAEGSTPKIKREEKDGEEEPSNKKSPQATKKLASIAKGKKKEKKSVSFAPTSRLKIIEPINPDTIHHIWFTKEEKQMMQYELSEDVRKTRKIIKQLRRSTSREEYFKLEVELRSIPTRGIEQFKSPSTHKKMVQEQRAVIDGVLNAQDEYWRLQQQEEASQSSSIDQASKGIEELILAHTSCALSLASRERAFEAALQDEDAALEIYKHMLHNGKKKQKVPARPGDFNRS